jgi:hypothetical protein
MTRKERQQLNNKHKDLKELFALAIIISILFIII